MIFADASFFIPAANGRDRWHADARRLSGTLRGRLVVSDFVIAEAMTQIGSRVGVREGLKLFHYFRDACEVRYTDSDLLEAAVDPLEDLWGRTVRFGRDQPGGHVSRRSFPSIPTSTALMGWFGGIEASRPSLSAGEFPGEP